jgi:predicted RNase H-like HicB family nuclease
MPSSNEFAIELLFDKSRDGRFHVHSPNVPGLHLAGYDLAAIRADIEPIVKDLLYHNSGVIVDHIRWVPSLEELIRQIMGPPPPPEPQPGKATYLVITGRAA